MCVCLVMTLVGPSMAVTWYSLVNRLVILYSMLWCCASVIFGWSFSVQICAVRKSTLSSRHAYPNPRHAP